MNTYIMIIIVGSWIKKIFISKLKKLGYEIVFEVEGNTLSKTKKSDPTLIRIVAKYIG